MFCREILTEKDEGTEYNKGGGAAGNGGKIRRGEMGCKGREGGREDTLWK
jgi:hypothetical protein